MNIDYHIVDLVVFAIANLANLLMVGIFLSRVRGQESVERVLGLVFLALGLPLAVALLLNILGGRGVWMIALPALLLLFMIVELIVDYILDWDFRRTRFLGPYLLLYYVSLMGMVGYSFFIGTTFGFITLATYFLQLFATWYSCSKVGHG
jgi:hypothetical protein